VDHRKFHYTEFNELCTGMGFNDKEIRSIVMSSRGFDILQSNDNCYFGTLLSTLETIIKKVKTIESDLPSMTMGFVNCIENAIKVWFKIFFDPILAAVVTSLTKI